MTDWPCQCGEDGWVEIDWDENKYPCFDCYKALVKAQEEKYKETKNGNKDDRQV